MSFTEILDRYWVPIVIVLIVFALVFIMVGHEYRDEIQSVLKRKYLDLPKDDIDRWSLSHLFLFMLIGFIKPNYHLTAFTVGAVFEVFEDYMASDVHTQLADCTNPIEPSTNKRKFFCNGRQDDYWYAKHSDVFWNLFGYTIGSAIRTQFFSDGKVGPFNVNFEQAATTTPAAATAATAAAAAALMSTDTSTDP